MDFVQLAIQKGLPPVPGDEALSAEHIDEVLNLLDARGFSVKEDGWIPKLPQVKGGGTYTRNQFEDGGEPISLAVDNVLENITMTASGAVATSRYWLEMRLNRLARAARDFWTGSSIQPVFLKWQAPGAPGAQYALIFDINVAQNQGQLISASSRVNELTFTVLRELGWLGIARGENPKHWTYISTGQEPSWGQSHAALSGGTDHLVYGAVNNKQQFSSLYVIGTANYIDIPASKIPGDLPALCYIIASSTFYNYNHDLYIARSTKPTTITDRASNALPLYNALPFSAATMSHADATLSADAHRGITHTPAGAGNNLMIVNFTASGVERFCATWATGGTGLPHISPTVLRGTFAIFVRAAQVNGTAGQVKFRLEVSMTNGTVVFDSGQVTSTLNTANGLVLQNIGTMTLPAYMSSAISPAGKGLQVESDLTFKFYATRSAGAGLLYAADIVLMPMDEGFIKITSPTTWGATALHIYDNTGYSTHGKPGMAGSIAASGEASILTEISGNEIFLEPNVNNRLYFLATDREATPAVPFTDSTFNVAINIIPRWSGIRDQ